MDLFKLAESNDPRAVKVVQHIYSWMVALDLMENIANESQSKEIKELGYEPKRELKKKNKAFVKHALELNKQLKKELGVDQEAEKFGDTADFLHELFKVSIFIKPEDRFKLIKTAQRMVNR